MTSNGATQTALEQLFKKYGDGTMNHVDLLRLPDIRIFRNWRDAPKGALLQMSVLDQIIIGMRTTYQVADRDAALLIVAGDAAGVLVVPDARQIGPALDIGAKVEIVACDPAPFETRHTPQLSTGALFRHVRNDKVYFVWFIFPNEHGLGGVGSGGVCVASNDPNCPVGECVPDMDRTKLLGVAPRITVKLREGAIVTD
jgi:hypothetical protein